MPAGTKGTIFTVFSTAYAVGKTLIAVNIAAELARDGFKVCLADLDLQFGDIRYYLKLEPEMTIADAERAMQNNPNEVKMSNYLTPFHSGNIRFDVLVNPDLLEEAYNMDISLIRTMVERLQLEYDYVIVDTTSTFSALNLSMMDLSTIIDFVGLVDFIPTIKNMKRGSDTLKELGYDDTKIRYVLNRSNARTRIDVSDVEQILGKHFDYVLPNDFMTAQKSIQSGEPLVQKSRDTELAHEICRMVDKYAKLGTEEEQDKGSKGGFFSRLFPKEVRRLGLQNCPD